MNIKTGPRGIAARAAFRVRRARRGLIHAAARTCSPGSPVPVFHHVPKCGGTSLLKILGGWYWLHRDYLPGWDEEPPPKRNLQELKSCDCLCGHFDRDDFRLRERYPGVFEDPDYFVFTVVRDPLETQLSMHRYAVKHRQWDVPLDRYLRGVRNFLAQQLQASAEDYRSVVDAYDYVGVLEQSERTVRGLADRLGKPYRPLPWTNRTAERSPARRPDVDPGTVAAFRANNALDQAIYDYCAERFERETAR